MLSPVPALVVPAPCRPVPAGSPAGELLDRLGPLEGSHVLVLGGGLALMSGLIRRGCLAVTMLRRTEKPEAAAHDVMLVPQVSEDECLDELVYQARRSLVPAGELLACLSGTAAAVQARRLALRLRLNGFSGARATPVAAVVLVHASLPVFTLKAWS